MSAIASIRKRELLSITAQGAAAIIAIAAAVALPLMMAELFGYGLFAGLLRKPRIPTVAKTLLAMLAGRVARMLLCAVFFYLLGNAKVNPMGIWLSVPQCLPGIVLQIVLIPLIVFRVEKAN